MYIPGPKPTFDIRDLISGSELDNDHLQARYDTVNRMVLLTGDITFQQLFEEEWKTLVPQIESRVTTAISLHLLRHRADLPGMDVASCLDYLSTQHPDLTWKRYLASNYRKRDPKRDTQLDRLYQVQVALWQQGIYLPCPPGCSDVRVQQEAIQGLLDHAGMQTHGGYYTRRLRAIPWSKEEIDSVKSAMKAGLLFDPCPNDRCCDTTFEECDGPSYNRCCFDCGDGDDCDS